MYSKNNFPNQKEGEEILLFLRRHWIAVFKILIIGIFLTAIPVIAYFILAQTTLLLNMLYLSLFILFSSAFFLFVIMFSFSNFIDYYLDVWIVTNQRVINIEQKGLFAREVSEKELERMQDITSDVKGFWATLFEYGDVTIQTAGEEQRFIFRQVPKAEDVSRQISNIVTKYREVVERDDEL